MNDYIIQALISLPIGGIAAWIGQIWATNIAAKKASEQQKEIEQMKSQLLARQNVFRMQFEKEFHIYESLCSRISAIRNSMAEILYRDEERISNEQQTRILKQINDYKDYVHEHEAFMSQTVYDHAEKLVSMFMKLGSRQEVSFYQNLDMETKLFFGTVRSHIRSLNAIA